MLEDKLVTIRRKENVLSCKTFPAHLAMKMVRFTTLGLRSSRMFLTLTTRLFLIFEIKIACLTAYCSGASHQQQLMPIDSSPASINPEKWFVSVDSLFKAFINTKNFKCDESQGSLVKSVIVERLLAGDSPQKYEAAKTVATDSRKAGNCAFAFKQGRLATADHTESN